MLIHFFQRVLSLRDVRQLCDTIHRTFNANGTYDPLERLFDNQICFEKEIKPVAFNLAYNQIHIPQVKQRRRYKERHVTVLRRLNFPYLGFVP